MEPLYCTIKIPLCEEGINGCVEIWGFKVQITQQVTMSRSVHKRDWANIVLGELHDILYMENIFIDEAFNSIVFCLSLQPELNTKLIDFGIKVNSFELMYVKGRKGEIFFSNDAYNSRQYDKARR